MREALQLAVERGIAAVARPDGFLGNPGVRIAVPEPLAKIETRLRQMGDDRTADRFVASLNHAAEEAAPAARSPLLATVAEIPADDARRVLGRGEMAGTDLLRHLSLSRVMTALSPAVAAAMSRERTARRYRRFVRDSLLSGLFVQAPTDLDAYVTERTVEGVFYAIGEEERRIRVDAAARTTPRLRQVFGGQR